MSQIEKAVKILISGGIVIFPTDTIFGIGCRIGDKNAIDRLYKIKGRAENKATLILVKDELQAEKYAYISKEARELMSEFWPGPLTLVLKAKNTVPEKIQANSSVGLRAPNFGIINSVIDGVGEEILAPSANFTGNRAPAKRAEIDKNLIKLVDYVIDFECGGNEPSTIVEILDGQKRIVREGALKRKLSLD